MTWRARIGGWALCAVAMSMHAAEPAGAPLANSKQELKALQADQGTKADPGAGKITGNLPEVGAPTPGETPLDLNVSLRTEKELKKRKDAQKNWLLDGMDKLGQNAKGNNKVLRDKGDLTETEVEDKPDSSDPDYLLKLYSEQKKKDEARADAKSPGAARNDPFAPFLQGWLANPAAGGKPFDGSGRQSDVAGTVAAPGLVEGGTNLSQTASGLPNPDSIRGHSNPAGIQPNPYLAAPVGPALPDLGAVRTLEGSGNMTGGPVAAPPNPAMVEPVPAGRPVEKKPQLLRPSDNDKYFPQQKKF
ncbi:MAG: hypothetical protein JWQ83_1504 [Lacunisphaera sp.]|nr:hypothetical protein [Lacunisphaera sp.]